MLSIFFFNIQLAWQFEQTFRFILCTKSISLQIAVDTNQLIHYTVFWGAPPGVTMGELTGDAATRAI